MTVIGRHTPTPQAGLAERTLTHAHPRAKLLPAWAGYPDIATLAVRGKPCQS